jgi:DNA-binding winged helix-turn-helix (wHTH) protein/TolB-like protein/Flp pilus assembly protein TadD
MVSVPMRIGEWLADPAKNELRRGRDVVRVEPKAMDLLVALACKPGQVMTREELLAAVWPGVVVGDEALSQSVTKLRRALGDESRSPRYIETISKRGYRLVAPVSQSRHTLKRWSVAATGLLLAGAALFFFMPRFATPPPEAESEERQAAWVTVTVLPFESLSPDGALFAQGVAENLATELGRVSGLRVISAAGATPGEAARRARYVVSGSVERDARLLRVNVRLVDTKSGQQLWADRLERPPQDLFAVQDEVIAKVTQSLPTTVSESERARLARRHTRSLEAYDLFLRAQALFLARGARENLQARELFRQAIEIDPQFARAYAGLAMTHAIEHRLSPRVDAAASLQRALALAQSALQIDPDLAEVYWALGFVHAQARRHPQALLALQRATELNASFADAYALMGGIHTYLGSPARSIPLIRTAMRLDPGGGYLYFLLLGRAYFFQDDLEQALINLREALVRNPADVETHIYLAATHAASGNRKAAEWETQEVRTLDPHFSRQAWLDGYPLSSPLHRERLSALLAKAGFD